MKTNEKTMKTMKKGSWMCIDVLSPKPRKKNATKYTGSFLPNPSHQHVGDNNAKARSGY